MKTIYLDNNATTPLLPGVLAAMQEYLAGGGGNASSQHSVGRLARKILTEASESIARLLGMDLKSREADRLLFTSGGTESNNLAILGACSGAPGHLIVSALEHPSVMQSARHLAQRGWKLELLPVDASGRARVDLLANMLIPQTRLVSLMLANHETGVLQPVSEAATICRKRGVLLHTDASQAVGKIGVDFRELGVDLLTVSPHKFHGPQGIGGLLVRAGVALEPLLFGGPQQFGLRPGTEPIPLIVGFQKSLEIASQNLLQVQAHLASLRDLLEKSLPASFPEVLFLGSDVPRTPHTSMLAVPGLNRQSLIMALDLEGVACSSGSACASGSTDPSPTLLAMGCDKTVYEGAIRFSFGQTNTAQETACAVDRISSVIKRLRNQNLSRK